MLIRYLIYIVVVVDGGVVDLLFLPTLHRLHYAFALFVALRYSLTFGPTIHLMIDFPSFTYTFWRLFHLRTVKILTLR